MTLRRAALVLAAALLVGCSGTTGVHHRVERGQTAYRIAKAYGLETRELLEINGIDDPRTLEAGQLLWIPGATRTIDVPPTVPLREEFPRPPGAKFLRPLEGPVSSGFGWRGGRPHDGIDILAPEGTPVRAAGYGVVIYAGNALRGYGNAVIVEHGEGVTTLYGHLREIRVQSGDPVAEGRILGTVGSTGNATTPHLHFEIRVGDEAVDPERYL